ncbi:pirin family protein [Nitrosomonas sp. Is37]|uniref:pirin family protein n=1 Tax=Nitrosomonas sp. Is37 TaxID=3080535 RepID=UPI00294ADC51|nr:pirin family protein [Nitrosomonas sp. Is37]MDV6344876.1 pirin family protein [Nitrosomonas sp. Is37]
MLELRPANARGIANLGWLYSQHTFSFGNYQDPDQMGFSDLLVINEDRVQPARGFAPHSHEDMEIFSYVLEGALEHRDSMGTTSVIRPGDVQIMSAGTGITHSEHNASAYEPVHFLQIWIVPTQLGVKPRYQQHHFDAAKKRGCLHLIISPHGEHKSLSIHQDIRVFAGLFDGDEQFTWHLPENRYAYVHIARGLLELNNHPMVAGDGMRVRDERELHFNHGQAAEVLVFDLSSRELPYEK